MFQYKINYIWNKEKKSNSNNKKSKKRKKNSKKKKKFEKKNKFNWEKSFLKTQMIYKQNTKL